MRARQSNKQTLPASFIRSCTARLYMDRTTTRFCRRRCAVGRAMATKMPAVDPRGLAAPGIHSVPPRSNPSTPATSGPREKRRSVRGCRGRDASQGRADHRESRRRCPRECFEFSGRERRAIVAGELRTRSGCRRRETRPILRSKRRTLTRRWSRKRSAATSGRDARPSGRRIIRGV